MRLHVTPNSPYARIVRIVVLEKGLEERVEIVEARTREANSPYYAINPSGRVPYLVRDDGVGMEGSALICRWLDRVDGAPCFDPPAGADGWEAMRLEAAATSLLDGLSVWLRELKRPEDERSPTIIAHEAARASRLTGWWTDAVDHPLMTRGPGLAQITLVCALDLDRLIPGFRWRDARPALAAWMDRLASRPSIAATLPPCRG